MAHRIPLSKIAFWGAWVLAGAVGYVLLDLGTAFGWFGPIDLSRDLWIAIVVSSTLIAFPQYVVLRLMIGRSSLAGAMWIPVSVIAVLAADLAIGASAERIANALLSVGAIQALMPGPTPFFTVFNGILNITPFAVLGLAQGVLLAKVFMARSVAWLWFAANLVAVAVILIVTPILFNGDSNQTAVEMLVSAAIPGALYAAVTGLVLVALPRRDRKRPVPVVD